MWFYLGCAGSGGMGCMHNSTRPLWRLPASNRKARGASFGAYRTRVRGRTTPFLIPSAINACSVCELAFILR